MRIKTLKLYTTNLELEQKFYTETLGFELIESNSLRFSLKIGWSILTFERSSTKHEYHYCFLIPSNKLTEALEWMEKRVQIVDIEDGRKTQRFESWNADSFYFYDASGNIAEFIVRPDLNNSSDIAFDSSSVLCVNEIGMPTDDVRKINDELEAQLGTKFWKGDIDRFATNGTQEGLFLLPNYQIKDVWFPTDMKLKPEPFEVIVENENLEYILKYTKDGIKEIIKC